MVWKLPWFRTHPEMEALWQQYVKPAQPWARLRERWWQKRRRKADGGDWGAAKTWIQPRRLAPLKRRR